MRSVLGFLTVCCMVSPLALRAQGTPPPLERQETPANVAAVAIHFPPLNFALALRDTDDPSTPAPDPDPPTDPKGSGKGSTTRVGKAHTTPISNGYVFPSSSELNRYWIKGIVGPRPMIGSVFHASWDTWVVHSPEEWGRDFGGWSQRFGASLLDNTINQSSLVLISKATHQDPRYFRCACAGFKARTGHALKSTVYGRNRNGDAVFSWAGLISPFTGPMVTRNTIYPDRFNSWDGLHGGAWYLAGTAGWNLVREFFLKGPTW